MAMPCNETATRTRAGFFLIAAVAVSMLLGVLDGEILLPVFEIPKYGISRSNVAEELPCPAWFDSSLLAIMRHRRGPSSATPEQSTIHKKCIRSTLAIEAVGKPY
jgi:hypothetical protein